jgi:hypothetical protein
MGLNLQSTLRSRSSCDGEMKDRPTYGFRKKPRSSVHGRPIRTLSSAKPSVACAADSGIGITTGRGSPAGTCHALHSLSRTPPHSEMTNER